MKMEFVKTLPRLLSPPLKMGPIRREERFGATRADVTVDVVTPQGKKRRLLIEVRDSVTPRRIRETLRQFRNSLPKGTKGYPVLASTFLSLRVREICREEGTGYLDLAGNCYLQFDDLYLEKVVDKNPFPQRGRPPSLFGPVSSRVVRALLEEPERRWQVRELVEATKVSLGQASNVTRRLLEEEYITKAENRIVLAQPAKLLDAWQDQYKQENNQRMAHYIFNRNPEGIMPLVSETAQTRGWKYAVTSFAAASLVAPFVRGVGAIEWYVEDATAIDLWVKALDLRPVEEGPNVALVIPYDPGVFYKNQKVDGIALVGNVQLYLDLYSNPARGREQAEFLRKERLKF